MNKYLILAAVGVSIYWYKRERRKLTQLWGESDIRVMNNDNNKKQTNKLVIKKCMTGTPHIKIPNRSRTILQDQSTCIKKKKKWKSKREQCQLSRLYSVGSTEERRLTKCQQSVVRVSAHFKASRWAMVKNKVSGRETNEARDKGAGGGAIRRAKESSMLL